MKNVMKKSLVTVGMLFAMASTANANQRNVVYKVDLSEDFSDQQFNQWSIADSEGNWPGSFSFRTPVKNAADVKATAKLAEKIAGDSCTVKAKVIRGKVELIVAADLSVDENSCEVNIQLKDGREANIMIENVGT